MSLSLHGSPWVADTSKARSSGAALEDKTELGVLGKFEGDFP